MNYISLFSSAGVGCFGFKQNGFECIATNELIERRLNIQRANRKCKYESGYICGDITLDSTKELLYAEIEMWKKKEKIKKVDVVIATPPCQGMSVANHKKTEKEIVRNSLVVESIKIIKAIRPRFFVFENVPAFMKTICTDEDGIDKPISEVIESSLGGEYSYAYRVLNFKNYGSNSSRQRTVVIGVSNEYADEVSPFELFPDYTKEPTLREVIGDMPSLTKMGEIDSTDIYHFFRSYPEEMREWIHDLKEGESAFDNKEDSKKPHQIIDGKLVINQNKNGDKYTRQCWGKIGPCIHTRNDQLASQSTIHPTDDRVFSIRELMRLMTVPDDFKWTEESLEYLNGLSIDEKRAYLKQNEIKIRQSLGEAVPTEIFRAISQKIKNVLSSPHLTNKEINDLLKSKDFTDCRTLIEFIDENPMNLTLSTLSRIAELSNSKRTENDAFYTNKALITEMIKVMPDSDSDEISILEPSAGVANFIPLIVRKFEGKKVHIDLVDINPESIEIAKHLIAKYGFDNSITFTFIVDDFLLHDFSRKYNFVIGNPPFGKLKGTDRLLREYKKGAINKNTTNICSFFLDKAIGLCDYLIFVYPKFILNTPEFSSSREYLRKKRFDAIIDFGEKGFPGVLIETIAIFIDNKKGPGITNVKSFTRKIDIKQKQNYIFDESLPYWLIYRDDLFDEVAKKMTFDVFDVVRDRQITNDMLLDNPDSDKKVYRVIKSRNISDDGKKLISVEGYDSYITDDVAKETSVYEYLNANNVYLTPNMTYYPRVMVKPPNTMVNGSVAILIPKLLFSLSEEQMEYYSSDEYRRFYQIARNYQTRSLNVDTCSVYFFGILNQLEEKYER